MGESAIARLVRNGRGQAVRLPSAFRFEGNRVRVRRVGRGVLPEPMFTNAGAWFAALDEAGGDEPFIAPSRPRRGATCSHELPARQRPSDGTHQRCSATMLADDRRTEGPLWPR